MDKEDPLFLSIRIHLSISDLSFNLSSCIFHPYLATLSLLQILPCRSPRLPGLPRPQYPRDGNRSTMRDITHGMYLFPTT